LALYVHTYELAPNSAAAASRILVGGGRRAGAPAGFGPRQPQNGRRLG